MTVTVSAPRIEHHREARGIGESRPRLSWTITSAPAGWTQTAARIEVLRGEASVAFDIEGSEQLLVAWPDEPLASREIAHVRVSVRGDDDVWSATGEWTTLEAGLLHPADWSAGPIGAIRNENPQSDRRRPSLVRTDFTARPGLVRARLYATAHGVYQAEI